MLVLSIWNFKVNWKISEASLRYGRYFSIICKFQLPVALYWLHVACSFLVHLVTSLSLQNRRDTQADCCKVWKDRPGILSKVVFWLFLCCQCCQRCQCCCHSCHYWCHWSHRLCWIQGENVAKAPLRLSQWTKEWKIQFFVVLRKLLSWPSLAFLVFSFELIRPKLDVGHVWHPVNAPLSKLSSCIHHHRHQMTLILALSCSTTTAPST